MNLSSAADELHLSQWPDEIQATGQFGLAWERATSYPMRAAG